MRNTLNPATARQNAFTGRHAAVLLSLAVLAITGGAGPALANPCGTQYSTCLICDAPTGLSEFPTTLAKGLAQLQHDTQTAREGGDLRTRPDLTVMCPQGTEVPNPVVRHTPVSRSVPLGPSFEFQISLGYRFDASNNGFTRHMGQWSFNYELFLQKADTDLWHLRDQNGTGPQWVGPKWSTYLGLTNSMTEIEAKDYSWLYNIQYGTGTNAYGTNILITKRVPEVDAGLGTTPGKSCASCGNGNGHPGVAPVQRPATTAEGYVFEPVDINADGTVEFYRLKQVVAADGYAMAFFYAADTNNTLTSMVDAVSNQYLFAYDPSGLLTNVLDVAGSRSTTIAYTNWCGFSYISQVTDMGGQVNRYGYEQTPGLTNILRMCSMDRPNRTGFDTTTITYAGTTNCTVHLPAGQSYGVRQSANGQQVFDERTGLGAWTAGYVENWAYSWHAKCTDGSEITLTGPNGEAYAFDWWDFDAWDNPIQRKIKDETLPDGTRRHFEWDYTGALASVTDSDADGNVIARHNSQATYFAGTQRPSQIVDEKTDPSSNVLSRTVKTYTRYTGATTNDIDAAYALTSEKTWTDASTYLETVYVYDTNNLQLAEVKELSEGTNTYRSVQKYGYDSYNRVAWSWKAGQATNSYTYDAFNRLSAITQTNSGVAATTSYFYDSLDRLTNTVYADGTSDHWTQAPCGCGWGTHTDRGGNVSSNFFNSNKWIWKTTSTSPSGTLLSYSQQYFDNNRNPTNTLDALGNSTLQFYDSSSRLTNRVDALGRATHYFYNAKGQSYLTVYPDGTSSSNTYDSTARLIRTSRCDSNGVDLTWTAYAYDSLDRQVTETDALGNVTSNTFDMASRIIRVDYPDATYSRTVFDAAGRTILQIGPVASAAEESGATVSNRYDEANRLVSVTDPEGRPTSYIYDDNWPHLVKSVAGADGTTNQVNSYDLLTARLLTNVSYGVQTVYLYDALGQVTNTLYADNSSVVNVFDGTRLAQTISRAGVTNSFAYDLEGRRTAMTNGLGQVTRFYFDALGNVTNTTDALGNSTLRAFDSMNRLTVTTLPDARASTNQYDSLGRLLSRTGAGSVPVAYQYDVLGRMTNLIDGVTNVTAFAYDSRGRLVRKTYADLSCYQYAYNPRGWLTNRVDAMNRSTAYAYNNAGQITGVDYPTDIDTAYGYDTLGRMTSRVDAAGTWGWTYDGASPRVLSEALSSASATSTVAYSYAAATFDLASVSCGAYTTLYSWAQGRITNVAWTAGGAMQSASYGYKPNSELLQDTAIAGVLSAHRTYDGADRLTAITNLNSVGGPLAATAYVLDPAGRRTRKSGVDGSQIDYGYDAFDQLTSAAKANSPNGAADAAFNYQYQYDLVGNRLDEKRGPSGDTLNRQIDLVGTFNNLNELTSRDWSGKLPMWGSVQDSSSVVVVQGVTNAPPYWNSTNWLAGATLAAGSNDVDIVTWLGTNSTRADVTLFMPPTKPQAFGYDENGNMTNDGYRVYTWTEENRLAQIETSAAAAGTGVAKQKSQFLYDGMGRRIQRTDFSAWNGAEYASTNVTRYVWDGWLLLAEMNADNIIAAYHVWGLDLAQSRQGAGGIGGLLARCDGGTTSVSSVFYAFDGNGNVSDVLDASGGLAAHYEFDPFGQTFNQTGRYAAANPWRFSTKQADDAWGLYYYGYRYYAPGLGRWVNRDPLAEDDGHARKWSQRQPGGSNKLLQFADPHKNRLYVADLYNFVANEPESSVDLHGLTTLTSITIKRKDVLWFQILKEALGFPSSGADKYGHWWIEFDGESYGWWPKEPVGLIDTVVGVDGDLNGQTHFGGSATKDPHHGDSADTEFHPERRESYWVWGWWWTLHYGSAAGTKCDCASEGQIKDCARTFAKTYSGGWAYPLGTSCHGFQEDMMDKCCMRDP